jgi:hypothetical protein
LARLGPAENGAAFPATKSDHQPLLVDLNDSESLIEGRGPGYADYDLPAAKRPLAGVFRALMKPRAKHPSAVFERESHLFKAGRPRNINPPAPKEALLLAWPGMTRAGATENRQQGGSAPESAPEDEAQQGTRVGRCWATKLLLPSAVSRNALACSDGAITPGKLPPGLSHPYLTVASNVPATKLLSPSSKHR